VANQLESGTDYDSNQYGHAVGNGKLLTDEC
jgi:hypothetical protein